MTCPKWPLCPAGLVPMDEFIIEYFHRSVAVATSILIIVTMAFTLKLRNITPNGMKISSLIAAAAAVGQVTLGAIVIAERLHAVLVTVHLGLGLVLFSMTLMTALYSYKIPSDKSKNVAKELQKQR
ncbi:MAG TPA: COX15/CtaA family protein [Candidatus Nitrosopolaris sp.]